jgi:Arc/MetJ-type ribon-helix-helix transcriptional regulator
LEEHEIRHRALQKAITKGLESGVAENFDMDALQQEIDHQG